MMNTDPHYTKKGPDYFPFQSQFGYIDLNGNKTRLNYLDILPIFNLFLGYLFVILQLASKETKSRTLLFDKRNKSLYELTDCRVLTLSWLKKKSILSSR